MPQTMEPVRTIYTEDWVRARSAVETLIGRGGSQPYSRALAQLEAAWEHVRQLEIWCEKDAPLDAGETERALRWHVEVEVVDLFRWITNETLQSIPTPQASPRYVSVDDLETELEALGRNVRILLLAVRARSVPRPIGRLVSQHARPLVDWTARFGDTVAAIRRYLDEAEAEQEAEG